MAHSGRACPLECIAPLSMCPLPQNLLPPPKNIQPAGAISTPFFMAIPIVTIWAGVFPIVVSWWAALGLTIYYIATNAVLYYGEETLSFVGSGRGWLGCRRMRVPARARRPVPPAFSSIRAPPGGPVVCQRV